MTAVTIDPDSVLWSAPERERAGRPLLVLMHGYGSHEGDLFGLSPQLPLGPVVASVRAPTPEGGGFAWFPFGGQADAATRLAVADDAAAAVLNWLDTLEYTSVGLLGFSQGGAMALQLLRLAPERFSYAVNLSGFALDGDHPGDESLRSIRPPVFWGRGTADTMISDALISITDRWLPVHSALTERIYEDLTHSISPPELADVSAFIREHLS